MVCKGEGINMLNTMVRAVLGGIGVINKTLHFKKTQKKEFLRSLPPGTIILTRALKPDFFQGAIQAVTRSAWQHVLIYFGQSNGKKGIRHEIVEAISQGVKISSLDKYLTEDTQMEAWARPLTSQELEQIKTRAYSQVGKPYDYAEFISFVLPFIPDPDDLMICSSLCYYAYEPVELLQLKAKKSKQISPRDLRDYFIAASQWTAKRFNW